jgi:hypothetical protein
VIDQNAKGQEQARRAVPPVTIPKDGPKTSGKKHSLRVDCVLQMKQDPTVFLMSAKVKPKQFDEITVQDEVSGTSATQGDFCGYAATDMTAIADASGVVVGLQQLLQDNAPAYVVYVKKY